MRPTTILAFLLLLMLPRAGTAEPRLAVEVEAGPVWQSRNEVEIPNDGTASRWSLEDLAGSGPWPGGRLTVTWRLAEKHGLRLLVAPLEFSGTGRFADPVLFQGETFAAATPTEGTYRFDSYRLGYRYRFHDGARWRWWVGFTAKIRDAEVALAQAGTRARKTDTGFVPLLHLSGQWRFDPRWRLLLEVEGLGGGPGRAIDAALKVAWDLDEAWSLAAGYRTIEGGADVDEVYSFAWLHYAVVSAAFRWGAVAGD